MTDLVVPRKTSPRSALLLGSLTAVAPVSLDLYLPALPQLSEHFKIGEAPGQLTLTACLVGLALGQLLIGPYSDVVGRRRPLLLGLFVYLVASLGCALAPSIEVLIGLRMIQGLAGAAGIVVARAVVRDLYSGSELARALSLLMLVNGLAPILAPLFGSQLMHFLPWQGLFVVLAGYGLLLLVGVKVGLPETLPSTDRHLGGLPAALRLMAALLVDRRFMGYALAAALLFAAMFCYIAGSPFVLQRIYGLSPQQFGLVFAANALGIASLANLSRILLRRHFPPSRLLGAGMGLATLGGIELLIATVGGFGLPAVLVGLFIVVASIGLVMPNATALALGGRPGQAGSASALFGVQQYLFAGIAAPLVGVFPTTSAVPMAALMFALSCGGLIAFVLLSISRKIPATE